MRLETDAMGDELKILRIPVMMAATDVATIDEWRRKQADLPSPYGQKIKSIRKSGNYLIPA